MEKKEEAENTITLIFSSPTYTSEVNNASLHPLSSYINIHLYTILLNKTPLD